MSPSHDYLPESVHTTCGIPLYGTCIYCHVYILACDYVVYVLARRTYFAQSMA